MAPWAQVHNLHPHCGITGARIATAGSRTLACDVIERAAYCPIIVEIGACRCDQWACRKSALVKAIARRGNVNSVISRLASDPAAAAAAGGAAAAVILTSIPTVSRSASAEPKLATTLATVTRADTTATLRHSERYCTREHNKSHQHKLSLHVAHPQLQYADSHKNNTRCTKSRAVQA